MINRSHAVDESEVRQGFSEESLLISVNYKFYNEKASETIELKTMKFV